VYGFSTGRIKSQCTRDVMLAAQSTHGKAAEVKLEIFQY